MLCNKKIAFYIRLSIEDVDLKSSAKTESNSVANQRKLLQDYYNSHPELKEYEVVEFCDDGYTGTNFNRPRFQEMMDCIKHHEIQCIMVKDLSRFGRDYLEVGSYLELILPVFGTRFISVNDNYDSNNYIGTTGGIELNFRNLINGMYSKDLSVKVRSAIRTRNRRGEYMGGYAFYGYRKDPQNKHKIVVDEQVRHIITRIFDECIAGASATQIAKRLNDDRIASPVTHKKNNGGIYNGKLMEPLSVWTSASIYKILVDERYTGTMISHKAEVVGVSTKKIRSLPKEEWIVTKDTHEAIISHEKFEQAANALKSRCKTVNTNTHSLKVNLFLCGYCGRRLQKSTGKLKYLYCTKGKTDTESLCARIGEDLTAIEDSVLQTVKIHASALVKRSVKKKAMVNQEIPRLKKKIADTGTALQKLKNGKLDLYEEYRQGRLTREEYKHQQDIRKDETERLSRAIEQYKRELEQKGQAQEQTDIVVKEAQEIGILKEFNPEIIGRLISQVYVFPGRRIEINYMSIDSFESTVSS